MKWEYKTIRIDGYDFSCSTHDKSFNYLGELGWEMVAAIAGNGHYNFIFKKIKKE